MAEFQVRKDNYPEHRIVETVSLPGEETVGAGDIVVKVTQFAFTANNITYAAAGELIGYWQFFPAHGDDAEGWGVIPVWGFAEVVRSQHPDVPVGEKLFGYFPPASELKITADNVSASSLTDASEHRSQLPPVYNRYQRVSAEPGYEPSLDAYRALLWPLYATGFCLGDALLYNDWYGAEQVIVVSASSKTSIGLGYALQDIADSPHSVGLTSTRNAAFVGALGLFDQVCSYDALDAIDTSRPTVIVDMAGNSDLMGRLHEMLGDNMRFTVNVGLTHWDQAAEDGRIIAERSEMFFAPGHMQQRAADWGPEEFSRRSNEFVLSGIERSQAWLKLAVHSGLAGLKGIYPDVCGGHNSPDQGQIIDMTSA